MNSLGLFLMMQLALVFIGTTGSISSSPFSTQTEDQGNGVRTRDLRKPSSKRRLRLIQKFLKKITGEDMMILPTKRDRRMDSYQSGEFAPYNTKVEKAPDRATLKKSDMPVIDCPFAEDEHQLFACPTPDKKGVYRCIDDNALCDGRQHCPNWEDEDATVCMFHRITLRYLKVLMNTILGLTRSKSNTRYNSNPGY